MDNIMDPELASEMVKLLGQELRTVRAQLREAEMRTSSTPSGGSSSNTLTHENTWALISENESLKADNATLQERVVNLQNELSQVTSIKPEEDAESTFRMREEFARLIAENESLVREKEEASRNHEKLIILHEKYQRTKTKVHEYNEIMNELRDALSNSTQELEQTRKAAVTEIDFRDFLNAPYDPVEGQLELFSMPSHDRGVHTKLCEDPTVCKGVYCITSNEVIWSQSGKGLGLVIKPAFQYNPKHRGGSWTKVEESFGGQMDVCYLSGKSCKTSRYLGTYERVPDQGIMVIAPETLQYLDPDKLDHASKRTTLHQDLVPPSQTSMIKNMYKQGVIKLQCFGIRCVAINQTFVQKLRDTNTSASLDSPVRTVIATPGISNRDTRKRKRDLNSTVQPKRKKKNRPSPKK